VAFRLRGGEIYVKQLGRPDDAAANYRRALAACLDGRGYSVK
jgi:hypothetical protein